MKSDLQWFLFDRLFRGGFVLRTRSDEIPKRRKSLVERSGMKNFVQVSWL